MQPWHVELAVLALLVGGALSVRAARGLGWLKTRVSRCERCRNHAPVINVDYHQNTGMLVMRRHTHLKAPLCRRCSVRVFAQMELHTLFLGWWGLISALVTPIFLITNAVYFVASLTLPSRGSQARSALDDQREYALNLIATKDEATVIDVLARQTGATRDDVARFLVTLRG